MEALDAMLATYCSSRDIELRNALIEKHAYIAEIAAKKFVGRGMDYDDLYQVASLALLRALERFDCERGVKFGSFAMPSVIGEIKNHFRDKSRTIRLPRRVGEMIKQLSAAQETLTASLGRPPKPEELSATLEIPLEHVYELLEAKNSTRVFSLDETVPGGESDDRSSLGEILGTEEKAYENIERDDLLFRSMSLLNEKEKDIIHRRFVAMQSQRTVATALGVSQMYVSRMERRILERMRQYLEQE